MADSLTHIEREKAEAEIRNLNQPVEKSPQVESSRVTARATIFAALIVTAGAVAVALVKSTNESRDEHSNSGVRAVREAANIRASSEVTLTRTKAINDGQADLIRSEMDWLNGKVEAKLQEIGPNWEKLTGPEYNTLHSHWVDFTLKAWRVLPEWQPD